MTRLTESTVALCGILCCFLGAYGAAPTFQELMDPAVFPDPQRGMAVVSAEIQDQALRVVTTGAELSADASGAAVFRQRIGHPRPVLSLAFEGGLGGAPRLTHRGPAFAFACFGEGAVNLRANGDSLFMFHVHAPVTVTVVRAIDVGFHASHRCNHLVLDEWGGFGLYCSEENLAEAFDPFGPVTARYDLPAGSVLWVGVCPPKPYDWDRSLTDHVVWHWSNQLGYPPDDQLVAWSTEGNIVLLQSEIMLWKDWNLAFEPRLGEPEFARVRRTMHDHDVRFIVYTSPAYFFTGTPFEQYAFNTFEDFKSWPPGRGLGDNIDAFMAETAKVMRQYKPDGLYFDGQYFSNPAALYALARRTRALLGEDGVLEWHSTTALGSGRCYLPHADAYVDFILRGEGRDSVYADFDYLRYFVSCYNSSNSIGVICNNGPRPTADLVERLLEANCRMHTIASWLNDRASMDVVHGAYKARLTPELRAQVERGVDQRQGRVAERAEKLAAEQRALAAPPAWEAPLLAEAFDAVPEWQPQVSPANEDPFATRTGALAVTGHAHTYAYLTRPVSGPARGLVVKLRQGTDGGMSWGPAACLRWKSGALLRIGLRNDGLIQSDVAGQQRLSKGQDHDPTQWKWLRARWLDRSGVIECSDDGVSYRRLRTFDHGAVSMGDLEGLSVGKVPYNGEPKDHAVPGESGTCFIDEVAVY